MASTRFVARSDSGPEVIVNYENETRDALAGTYTAAGIQLWLTVTNPRTYNLTPLEAIRDGFGEKVLALAKRLAAGRKQ